MVPFIEESVILGGFYTPGVGIVDRLQAGTLMRQKAQDLGALTSPAASRSPASTSWTAGSAASGRTRATSRPTPSSSPAASGARGSPGWPARRSR